MEKPSPPPSILDQGLILFSWCTFSLFFSRKNSRYNTKKPNCNPSQTTPFPFFFPPFHITPITYPLLPFDFPASCVYPRIHEAVRVPGFERVLKVDEPKLFTWTDLARTNTDPWDPLVHPTRMYMHHRYTLSKRVDRTLATNTILWRTLWNEILSPLFRSLSVHLKIVVNC